MTDYRFTKVLVWDNLGGSVKVARNSRVTVTDPGTGVTAAGLKVNGQPVPWVTSDSSGHAEFTATIAEVRLIAPGGFWQDVTSSTAVLDTARSVATDTATTVATQVAQEIARGDSHVLLDTDGAPYFDTSAPGTQVMQVDTDGVPYFI